MLLQRGGPYPPGLAPRPFHTPAPPPSPRPGSELLDVLEAKAKDLAVHWLRRQLERLWPEVAAAEDRR